MLFGFDVSEHPYNYIDCPICGHERGKRGRIRRYKHIEDGKCFQCNGTGRMTKNEAIEYQNKWLKKWQQDSPEGRNMSFNEYKTSYFKRIEDDASIFDD